MQQNELFRSVIEQVMNRRLGKAIGLLENHLLTYPNPKYLEQLEALKNDYQLMSDYWQRGFDDPKREQLYDQLLRRLYTLCSNLSIYDNIDKSSFLASCFFQPRRKHVNWTMADVRSDLESYVSDVAMLSLEPEHVRQEKAARLHEAHASLMNDLFDYIWTSFQWKDQLAQAFEDILLSPTIDTIDQQLIVSAIMLSAMNYFDFNKFRVLANVYRQTADEALRQRALVGWVLCIDEDKARLFSELTDLVGQLCQDERCCKELAELQVQLVYCISAEADTRTIQREIMPEIMKRGNLRINNGSLEETDDDPMEDILHPDAVEQNMEKLEGSIRRMVDMQKQGSDIYFAGFSQMKRFTFFDRISNWFVPFYPQHPGISSMWNQQRGAKFLHSLISLGAFCDSDKYSFVLACNQVFDRLPKNLMQMVERGEAMPIGGEVAIEEQRQPAFIRRVYLQNLYRFFRLYPMRSQFRNPFPAGDAQDLSYVFFGNSLFRNTPLAAHFDATAAFFMKRKMPKAATRVLENYTDEMKGYRFFMMMGRLLMQQAEPSFSPRLASDCFSKAAALKPDSEKALAGYARASFADDNYEAALQAYEQLMALQPDHAGYQLNAAVCMAYLSQNEKAMKLLYKLNYEAPDDLRVVRALAWVLTNEKKYEQALKLYAQLQAAEQPQPDDLLNYGYCLWFSGDVAQAVDVFRQFLSQQKPADFSMEHELLSVEWPRLQQHGITRTQALLLLDALGC